MNASDLSQLRARVQGPVLAPGDNAYEQRRRTWNGTIDRRPAVIVQPRGVADVQTALAEARRSGLTVSVRGGGHHVAGDAVIDSGLVIDLSLLRGVEVDAAARRVRAQGGATLGDIDAATAPHSLVVASGVVSETGIAGLTLAGGLGWLRRKHGFSADNLVSAEVVTADGSLLRASDSENGDLIWALRGGGWGLGVVTSFEFQAHPLEPEVMTLFVLFPMSAVVRVLRAYERLSGSAPDEFGALAVLGTVPAVELMPREAWDQPFAGLIGPYCGPAEEGRRFMQPLRELGIPLVDLSGTMPFVEAQKLFDEDYPEGKRYYWKSVYLNGLGDAEIDKLIDLAGRRPSAASTLDVWLLGGALARKAPGETPLEQRQSPFLIGIEANWDDPSEDAANRDWARFAAEELKPFSSGASYLNFEDLGEEQAAAAARGPNQARLAQVKAKYDPSGRFHARKGLF